MTHVLSSSHLFSIYFSFWLGVIAGKEVAEQLLVYTSPGLLHHYFVNTDNLDVVGLYLNELPEKHSKNIEVRQSLSLTLLIISYLFLLAPA